MPVPAGLDGNPDPIVTPARQAVLAEVADLIVSRRRSGRPLLVGVDGIDGSGKSTFADEVAGLLEDRLVPVVRSTIDSFHRPRADRHRRGPTSPVGFYLDSHDLDAFRRELLDPIRAGAGARYRTAVFDEPNDSVVDEPSQVVTGDEVVLVDGIFLCRPELAEAWDVTVFLDGRSRVELSRLGLVLDGAPAGGDELVDHVLGWVARIDRYASGMRYYLDTVDPMSTADLVIDNNDLAKPFVIDR